MVNSIAYAETRVILARLVWNFDMTLADGGVDYMEGRERFGRGNRTPLMVHLKPRISTASLL